MACAVWTVRVVEGPDRGQSWRALDVATRRVLIGQGPTCDVRLSDASVARRHAALEYDGAALHVVDLGAPQGTWLGTVRICEAFVRSGEVVHLGDTKLAIEAADTDSAGQPLLARPIPSDTKSFGDVVGESAQMRALFPTLERLAQSAAPLLIEGEPGTGKRLVAEAMHRARGRGTFVVFEREADVTEGTLFFEEVADLSPALQAYVVRLLDDPNGPRIVAATRRDLEREVEAGRFREDLLVRLAATRIELPPLRKREGDVVRLAAHFAGDTLTLTSEILAFLDAYAWPGNVTQLKAAIEQLRVRSEAAHVVSLASPSTTVAPASFARATDFLENLVTSGMTYPVARDKVVEEFTRRYTEHMLRQHNGNVTRAAAASGIGRRYFQMVRTKV